MGWCRSTVAVGINLGSSNRLFEAVGSARWGINFWFNYRRDLGQIWLDIGERFWFHWGSNQGLFGCDLQGSGGAQTGIGFRIGLGRD